MGEIKFRAWDLDNERFVYLVIGHHSRNPVILPPIDAKNIDEWKQFTGLKDKNGKEIYEGDILKYIPRGDIAVIRNFIEDTYWAKDYWREEGTLEVIGTFTRIRNYWRRKNENLA